MNEPTIGWLPLPCWMTDQEGQCIWGNTAWQQIAGDDEANWLERLHPQDRDRLVPALASAWAGGMPLEAMARIRLSADTYKWAVLRAYPYMPTPGDRPEQDADAEPAEGSASLTVPKRYVFVAIEMSEQQSVVAALHDEEVRLLMASLEDRVNERTRELQRINEELDQFAYVASHDLRAPLRAIDHLATWITEDAGDVLPPRSHEHLAKMRGRIARMERLLEDLLTYSRAGRQRGTPAKIRLPELVTRVVDVLAPPNGFNVTFTGYTKPIVTMAVPLETVLRNLIGNAIKHHDRDDGVVQVHAERKDNWLHIAVSDNGPGINSAFHERIFQMFQTLRPRDEVEGSGIGLSVVKKIIENMGGKIELTSAPGEGATFAFTWPLEPEPDSETPPTTNAIDRSTQAKHLG